MDKEHCMKELDEGIKVRDVGRYLLPDISPLPFNYWRLIEIIWSKEHCVKESLGKLNSAGYTEGRN